MPESGPKTGSDSKGTIRIVLVEDHVILRDGLRSLLDMEADFNVVGEAESCDRGLEVLKEVAPDLVVTDIGLPGRSGLTLIPEIKAYDKSIKVLVLTAHCTDEYVRAALESGADGYVLKDASRLELMTGIRTVMSGQQYFSTLVTSRVVSGFLDKTDKTRQRTNSKITPRETEVMIMIASALSTKEIANKLDLSVKTVEKHRSNLMRKLGLRSTAAVTLYAVRNNYLSADGEFPPR
ncbi:MAG: response regulator transcription factor [Woeseiaceae bacterium]|jgi:DNA-binding NarL/FixJ family response regulator